MPKHAKTETTDVPEKKQLSTNQKKSRRMRRILIVVIILIVALIAALGYFTVRLFEEAQTEATQQAISQTPTDVDELKENDANDAITEVKRDIEPPELLNVFGLTEEEALKAIGHGATVTSSTDVNEEGNPIKKSVRVTLTDDPSDSRSGSIPTVYLDFNEEGKVVLAGYSASVSSLGYDISSFTKAITEEHIVEKTLTEAGLVVAAGSAELPENKEDYSVYSSDGTTLQSASYSFSGFVGMDENTQYDWSAVVRFDYTKANSSGNLNDTIAQIYIYVSNSGLAVEAAEGEKPADDKSAEGETSEQESEANEASTDAPEGEEQQPAA